jgi:hypothetical protein
MPETSRSWSWLPPPCFAPLQLRKQRVFWRGDEDARAKQIGFDAAAHLLYGKWPRLPHDQVRLPGGGHVDDIELPTTAKRIDAASGSA